VLRHQNNKMLESLKDFKNAKHTIIVSDLHLSDAEPPHPGNPLWKRFKRPKLFIDRSFRRMIDYLLETLPKNHKNEGEMELVLNGDIFDFDSVMVMPEKPPFNISWLEKKRGLLPEEAKSRFKMRVILRDHSVWVEALRIFVEAGNRLIFVIGNHDIEMHWPSVQEEILEALKLSPENRKNVRFCEWYYISNEDTLIEHGNQYDSYCMAPNPAHPLIRKGSKVTVRIPFGNLAGKYMINGMGLFNPHVESSYIKPFKEYIVFFYRYVMRVQPLIVWTWFWSAVTTLVISVTEGLLPPLRDPLTVENRLEEIAAKSNSTPRVTRQLLALHVHPAIFNPYMILKELWLDRMFLLVLIIFICFEIYTFVNLIWVVSIWWFITPFMFLFPLLIFYARSIESDIYKMQKAARKMAPLSAQICQVKRIIQGHTHRELHHMVHGIELLNTGTWSPAYRDVECTEAYGRKCFAWIHPNQENPSGPRVADLFEWKDPGTEVIRPLL
jgi:UDP-2,3-diacylglucosamine pyrophosphatase LpxH